MKDAHALPIHFFTIVLNGEPFIRHHVEVFRQLSFPWHWHVIEGVAELKHCTGWSAKHGGRIDDEIHRGGLSKDGTSEYLEDLSRLYPQNISLYRKRHGEFWEGKVEMISAPLSHISDECLLWQVDADELWTCEQIERMRQAFLERPEKTAARYFCHYFVSPDLVISTRDTYGNNSCYEWQRTWRYTPGCRWASHEPPRLCRPAPGGGWQDLQELNSFSNLETEALGAVFQHFAYVTKEQLRFKEIYYGYSGAVRKWSALQKESALPAPLRRYFDWVQDEAMVDLARRRGVTPLARVSLDGSWRFVPRDPLPGEAAEILYVRTDAIGDAVLSAGMLEGIASKHPSAAVTVVCASRLKEIYDASPFVHRTVTFDARRIWKEEQHLHEVLHEIQRFAPFDVVYNPVYSPTRFNHAFALAAGGKEVIGLHGDLSNMHEAEQRELETRYTRLIRTAHCRHELDRNSSFAAELNLASRPLNATFWLRPEDEEFAASFFTQKGLGSEKTIALFSTGQFEIRSVQQIGRGMAAVCREHGFSIVALGGEGDRALNQRNLDDAAAPAVNISGQTTLRQSAAILKRCAFAVGVETGLAHIASAVGVPHLILAGGGHFGRFMPYSPLTSIITVPLNCFYCNWYCRFPLSHCVRDISPASIECALRHCLSNPASRARVYLQTWLETHSGGAGPSIELSDGLLAGLDAELIALKKPL